MSNTKFSKSMVSIAIWNTINALENEYNFKSYDGWNQVKDKGEEINRAYGKYECLLELTNDFDLPYITK